MKKKSYLVIVFLLIALTKTTFAVPADGSYECEEAMDKAKPAWQAGSPFNSKMTSAVEWIEAKDGFYEKKPDAPKSVSMHARKVPVVGKNYTVEFRFKIIEPKGEKAYPFRLVVSKRGGCYTWTTFGWLKSKPQISFISVFPKKLEFAKVIKDNSVIQGWQVVRQTVEKKEGKLEVKIYLNNKEVQNFTTDSKNTRSDFIYLQSYGAHILWSLDYIRWASKIVPIKEPLDKPLDEAGKKADQEKKAKKGMDNLFK